MKTFQAGCLRTQELNVLDDKLYYFELAFPECPSCEFRLEPEDQPPCCVWADVSAQHPFAVLSDFKDALD